MSQADAREQTLPAYAEELAALRSGLIDLRSELDDVAGRAAAPVEGAIVDARGALEARFAVLEAQLGELTEGLESLARDGARTTTERLADVTSAVRELSERLVTLPAGDRGAAAGAVREALQELGAAVDKGLESLGSNLSMAVRDARERDREQLGRTTSELSTTLTGSLAEVRDALTGAGGALAQAVSAQVQEALDRSLGNLAGLGEIPTAARTAVEGELSALRVDLADALEEIRDRVSEQVARATGDVAGRLGEVESSLSEARGVLSWLRGEWADRTSEVVAEARLMSEAVLDEARAEMTAAMAEVHRALREATGGLQEAASGLDGGTQRLADTGRGLLAYLAERDRLLEAERDHVLHELLDEFAEGLSAKERRALSGRFGEALQRRRDARDAARWRGREPEQAQGGEVAQDAPVPPPVELYLAGAPAKKAPAKQAAAKKAPAKKAPAKQAAAKKAPAKKAPAKKAPAKQTAAKQTAAKQRPIVALDEPATPAQAPGQQPRS